MAEIERALRINRVFQMLLQNICKSLCFSICKMGLIMSVSLKDGKNFLYLSHTINWYKNGVAPSVVNLCYPYTEHVTEICT